MSLMRFLLVDQKQKGLFMTLFVMYQYKKRGKTNKKRQQITSTHQKLL
jgi:hypothetical protein